MKTITKNITLYTIQELKELNYDAYSSAHNEFLNDLCIFMDQWDNEDTTYAMESFKPIKFPKKIWIKFLHESDCQIDWKQTWCELQYEHISFTKQELRLIRHCKFWLNTEPDIYGNTSHSDGYGLLDIGNDTSKWPRIDSIRRCIEDKLHEIALDAELHLQKAYARQIEWQCSEEYFIEHCEANEWLFNNKGELNYE